jgi:hypothetical protein
MNQILTPAMDTDDQACDYFNWLNSTVYGSQLKLMVRNFMTDSFEDVPYSSVQFVKFETSLY